MTQPKLPISQAYWSEPPDQLAARLGSGPQGLSAAEAARRLAQVGPNLLQEREKATALGLFLNQFKSPIILILLLATVVSIIVGDTLDAVIILAIVLGSAALSFIQEYGASNAAEKLRS
ncbi:MAG TPA: cation-transporting P-type ATPase, partial [Anaerolineales bacterium]